MKRSAQRRNRVDHQLGSRKVVDASIHNASRYFRRVARRSSGGAHPDRSRRRLDLVGIRFRPGGAAPLLRASPACVTDLSSKSVISVRRCATSSPARRRRSIAAHRGPAGHPPGLLLQTPTPRGRPIGANTPRRICGNHQARASGRPEPQHLLARFGAGSHALQTESDPAVPTRTDWSAGVRGGRHWASVSGFYYVRAPDSCVPSIRRRHAADLSASVTPTEPLCCRPQPEQVKSSIPAPTSRCIKGGT